MTDLIIKRGLNLKIGHAILNRPTTVSLSGLFRDHNSGSDKLKFVGHLRGHMSKIWDEREKSLENEYFHRKEQELIEKLRAKRAEEEQREETAASAIHCPKCDGTLTEITFEDMQIDRCNKCNGVWLDAGELERLIGKEETGWLSRMWQSVTG